MKRNENNQVRQFMNLEREFGGKGTEKYDGVEQGMDRNIFQMVKTEKKFINEDDIVSCFDLY